MKTITSTLIASLFVLIFAPAIVFAQTGTSTPQGLTLISTLLQMPGYQHFSNNSVMITGAYYKDGRFYVTSSMCLPRTYGANSRGQWVYTETGQLIGEQDVCDDGGVPSIGVHDWSVSNKIQFDPSSPGRFVREIEFIPGRGLLSYAVSGGAVSYLSRIPGPGQNPSSPYTGNPVIEHPAVTNNGYVVAVRRDGNQRSNVVYQLPSFSLVGSGSYVTDPVTGFGPYVIGVTGFGDDTNLYRVGVSGNLEFVRTLVDNDKASAYTFDESVSPARLVLYVPIQNGGSVSADTLITFELQGSDVVEVSSDRVSSHIGPVNNNSVGPFGVSLGNPRIAVSGDYAVTGKGQGGLGNAPGTVEVWQNGSLIAEATLPESESPIVGPGGTTLSSYPAELAIGFAMSPSGRILVVNRYGAYLYQLGGVSPVGPTPTIPGGAVGIPITGVNDLLSIASSYLQILRGLIGGQQTQSGTLGNTNSMFDSIYNEAINSLNLQ